MNQTRETHDFGGVTQRYELPFFFNFSCVIVPQVFYKIGVFKNFPKFTGKICTRVTFS